MVKVEEPKQDERALYGWRCLGCGASNRDTRWSTDRDEAYKKARRHIYRQGSCDAYESGGNPEIEIFEV